jgi:putative FmdB family regulatory protein
MQVQEYGCNECRVTFKEIDKDKVTREKNVKCPRCGSGKVEKLDSAADKLRFFTQFAFGGG